LLNGVLVGLVLVKVVRLLPLVTLMIVLLLLLMGRRLRLQDRHMRSRRRLDRR